MATSKIKSKKTVPDAVENPLVVEQTVTAAPTQKAAKKPAKPKLIKAPETIAKTDEVVLEEPEMANKKQKHPKTKVIRDSFSFPEPDYELISELKKTCLAAGVHVKKGEILRAGLHLLSTLNIKQLKAAIAKVDRVKTGRPKA